MTYIRVDDRFPEHPKVLDIGPVAEALWLRALCYAGRNQTDGFIPVGFVKRMADLDGLEEAGKLVDAGLWVAADGGWAIHEYTDWQRSKDQIQDISAKRAAAGSKGGKQKASNLLARSDDLPERSASKTYPETTTETEAKTETETSTPLPPAGKPSPDPMPPSSPSSYEQSLNTKFPEFASRFNALDPLLDETWLRFTLRRIEPQVGALPAKGLRYGLGMAHRQIELRLAAVKAAKADPVHSPRKFAETVIVSQLQEQRDGTPSPSGGGNGVRAGPAAA